LYQQLNLVYIWW